MFWSQLFIRDRFGDRQNWCLVLSSCHLCGGRCCWWMSHQACQNVLSVKTHRRVATGNTKSREIAEALAGTASSSMARNSSTRRAFWRCRACHLTYTRSGRCERACNDLPEYTNTWKRKSEPWSAPRDDSCIGFKEPIESRCQIGSAYPDGNR